MAEHADPVFRDLRIDVATCSGVSFCLSLASSGGACLEAALTAAGIGATVEHLDLEPDPLEHAVGAGCWDAAWDDAELQDCMMSSWAEAGKPGWHVWLLCAGIHEEGATLAGLMFDGPDSPDGLQRQGAAVFARATLHVAGALNPNARRHQVFTAVHEVGHALNLAHSWQKDAVLEGVSQPSEWAPHPEPGALSWMNYPHRVRGFSRRFPERFSGQELRFLRHAPDEFVRMGGRPFFVDHGLGHSSLPLVLEVVGRLAFLPGEPLHLSVRVRRRGWKGPRVVASGASRQSGNAGRVPAHLLRVMVEEEGRWRLLRPYGHRIELSGLARLGWSGVAWGDVFGGSEPRSRAWHGRPGVTRVRVALLDGERLVGLSAPVPVVVTEGPPGAEPSAEAVQRWFALERSVRLPQVTQPAGVAPVQVLTHLAEASPIWKLHAQRLIGGARDRARRSLEGRRWRVSEPDPRAAIQALTAYLSDDRAWEQSPALCARLAVRAIFLLERHGPRRERRERREAWRARARVHGDVHLERSLRGPRRFGWITAGAALFLGCVALIAVLALDADGDGHWVALAAPVDCDDRDASIFPGAVDMPYDGVDQDCDGADACDVDGDGHPASACGGSDCDDARADVHPRAKEGRCAVVDVNCDGLAPGDRDGDGHPAGACRGSDCDDTRADVHPRAPEVLCDRIDQNCDGRDMCWQVREFTPRVDITGESIPAPVFPRPEPEPGPF